MVASGFLMLLLFILATWEFVQQSKEAEEQTMHILGAKVYFQHFFLLQPKSLKWNNVVDASEQNIKSAVKDTVPNVTALFFSFRAMVASAEEQTMHILGAKVYFQHFFLLQPKSLKWKVIALRNLRQPFALPLPWIAAQTGWYVAEGGRQPWSIGEILPTHLQGSGRANNAYFRSQGLFSAFLFATAQVAKMKSKVDASEQNIKSAVKDTVPNVTALFFSFRAMVASGFLMLLLLLACINYIGCIFLKK
jgi:cytochrome bd-type quinol oxidase subunit 1